MLAVGHRCSNSGLGVARVKLMDNQGPETQGIKTPVCATGYKLTSFRLNLVCAAGVHDKSPDRTRVESCGRRLVIADMQGNDRMGPG